MYRERADAMREALDALPPELSDVVRLRLFDQLSLEEIAQRLDLGVSAVCHRFRKGADIYRKRLKAVLTSRSHAISGESAIDERKDSSPR